MKNAVIDTNVIVSALLTKNPQSPTARILDAVMDGEIVPLARDHRRIPQSPFQNTVQL